MEESLASDVVYDFKKLKERVLAHRGWTESDLLPTLDYLRIAPLWLGMSVKSIEKSVKRIQQAREEKQRVMIFGDYDVDGTCGVAVLWLALKRIGLEAVPFIPDRVKDGYGMSVETLEKIFKEQGRPDLIITVDNGIVALKAVRFCQTQGTDIIITDHHLPGKTRPQTKMVVHSTQLSGSGVAWILVRELYLALGVENLREETGELLDLVAVATLVDQVPQLSINRQLTLSGFLELRKAKRTGLKALAKEARLDLTTITGHEIGFGLGPRINAVGRLTGGLDSLRLLCTGKTTQAEKLAEVLNRVNSKRQEMTEEMMQIALEQIDEKNLPAVLVVVHHKFHEGIIGLLASRLVDKYDRPSIVISVGRDVCKGSCRSVSDFNITKFVELFRRDLLDYGGHALAAGFSVSPKNLYILRRKIISRSEGVMMARGAGKRIKTEVKVSVGLLASQETLELLEQLEPSGAGNPELVLQVEGKVAGARTIGSEGQHLKIELSDEAKTVALLMWNFKKLGVKIPTVGEKLKVWGQAKRNSYRGQISTRLIGLAIRKVD